MKKEILYDDNIHQIILVRGSVLDVEADAIVNAANSTLLGGGGVDGAIHQAAGPLLLSECKKLGGCKTGEAKITKAYDIKKAKYIIHTVGPIYSGSNKDPQKLIDCYKNSLDLAVRYNCHSIAFPCISAGAYGYPLQEAGVIALGAINEWILIHYDYKITIMLCCFKDIEFSVYLSITNI